MTTSSAGAGAPISDLHRVLPVPASTRALDSAPFELTESSTVVVVDADPAVGGVAERFAAWLRTATGFSLPVRTGGEPATGADVTIAARPGAAFGDEGYALRADGVGVRIDAATAVGAFRGVTTLRQLLPVAAEASTAQPGPWVVAAVEITDAPRFAYRGTMLDVARHFFPVEDVLRHLELIALHKINVLHLHLSDDQGWRVTVPGWPRLTEIGGSMDIDGGPGGWYTPEDYARMVDFAAQRFIEIVPEIDGPGHATAALIAYPQLDCDGVAPPPFEQGGISEVSLCVGSAVTYDYLGDVFATLAAEPGTFIHLGCDEAIGTPHEDFLEFVPRAAAQVVETGRRPMMWHEAAQATLPPGSVVQYWGTGQGEDVELARAAVSQGAALVLSPANHAYLDMKYEDATPYGLTWAGLVPVSASYAWDPGTLIPGVEEASVLGVESALWSETTADRTAVELMAFPRLAGIAEIGWSPAAALRWEDYRLRLAAQGERWDVLGVGYFRSPEVPWSS